MLRKRSVAAYWLHAESPSPSPAPPSYRQKPHPSQSPYRSLPRHFYPRPLLAACQCTSISLRLCVWRRVAYRQLSLLSHPPPPSRSPTRPRIAPEFFPLSPQIPFLPSQLPHAFQPPGLVAINRATSISPLYSGARSHPPYPRFDSSPM